MARKIRMEYAGAVYHVMARGNQGRAVFADDLDRTLWLGEESGVTRAVRWVKANPDAELKRLKAQLLKGATE